jgi:hypothetical protein
MAAVEFNAEATDSGSSESSANQSIDEEGIEDASLALVTRRSMLA